MERKERIWMRLGGFVSATPEQTERIMEGDKNALYGAIKEEGFEIEGDSYIPEGIVEGYEDEEEVGFELDGMKLVPGGGREAD